MRLIVAGNGFGASIGAKTSDRVYISLPLYHASAALIGGGLMLFVLDSSKPETYSNMFIKTKVAVECRLYCVKSSQPRPSSATSR